MKVYTGKGDKGQTSLYGGEKVSKDNLRVQVYGTLDELNSMIGFLRSKNTFHAVDSSLHKIQNDIFTLSTEIASSGSKNADKKIDKNSIIYIENLIDSLSDELAPLKKFILPGGSEAAAVSHLARTICRRAERQYVELLKQEKFRSELLVYMNRLSDFFFVLARYINFFEGIEDTLKD